MRQFALKRVIFITNLGGTAEAVFRPIWDETTAFLNIVYFYNGNGGCAMKITKELVEYVASLSRIKLDEASIDKMKNEIGAVVDYMEILNQVDTKDVEPLSHVFSINNVMREDVVKESFDRDSLIENAPEHTEETVVVPKTVE